MISVAPIPYAINSGNDKKKVRRLESRSLTPRARGYTTLDWQDLPASGINDIIQSINNLF